MSLLYHCSVLLLRPSLLISAAAAVRRSSLRLPLTRIHDLRAPAMASSSSASHLHTNRLAAEHSPYLLQHAHNPVLLEARKQDQESGRQLGGKREEVIQIDPSKKEELEFWEDKNPNVAQMAKSSPSDKAVVAHVCENFMCKAPIADPATLQAMLTRAARSVAAPSA